MKRLIFIAVFSLLTINFLKAQVRQVKGSSNVEISARRMKYGTAYGVSYAKYFSKNTYVKLGSYLQKGSVNRIPYEEWDLRLGIHRNLLVYNRWLVLHIGINSLIQYATQKINQESTSNSLELNFGLNPSFGVDVFVYNKWAVMAGFEYDFVFLKPKIKIENGLRIGIKKVL